ncbi:MAG: tRNA 2-thiouridine(34) synthase MnmA [Acidimicrobiales bacterium]
MRVLVAMSGGVDSSVAAALLVEAGHDVTGVTMKLWGGASDTGCCSVADVDDARRVAQQLDIEHLVFNFGDDFMTHVVDPYVEAHQRGDTPNPCIECNRHLKFDRLLRRADALGFDAVATGHHARILEQPDGTRRLARGADPAKDQSYVLYVLGPDALARVLLPVGTMTKADVRAEAARLGLRTADKPDSQDVCFITATGGGRRTFLGDRIELHPGRLIDPAGRTVGEVGAVELVTVGQRKGLGLAGAGEPRYAVDVDVPSRTVTVGPAADLLEASIVLTDLVVAGSELPPAEGLVAQGSAHGIPRPVTVAPGRQDGSLELTWCEGPQRRIARGQSVVLYAGDEVVAGGIVA